MADKFWTTQNKKIMATVALVIAAWHVILMGANPLNLPALPALVSTPLISGISLLTVSGAFLVFVIYMIWVEY